MSKLQVTLDDQTFLVELEQLPASESEVVVRVNGEPVRVRVPASHTGDQPPEWIVIDDRPYEVAFDRDHRRLRLMGQLHSVQVRDLDATVARPISRDGRIKAPIPGQITRVFVQVGQTVAAGEPLLILEAMKMENQVRATRSGTVTALNVSAGQGVSLHQVLAEIS